MSFSRNAMDDGSSIMSKEQCKSLTTNPVRSRASTQVHGLCMVLVALRCLFQAAVCAVALKACEELCSLLPPPAQRGNVRAVQGRYPLPMRHKVIGNGWAAGHDLHQAALCPHGGWLYDQRVDVCQQRGNVNESSSKQHCSPYRFASSTLLIILVEAPS